MSMSPPFAAERSTSPPDPAGHAVLGLVVGLFWLNSKATWADGDVVF